MVSASEMAEIAEMLLLQPALIQRIVVSPGGSTGTGQLVLDPAVEELVMQRNMGSSSFWVCSETFQHVLLVTSAFF